MNNELSKDTNSVQIIDEKIKKLDDAIQELLEATHSFFHEDKYYGIESAFILDHALNIKMHFFSKYPELAPPHLRGVEKTYDRIVHIREKKTMDRLAQVDPSDDS